VQDLTVDLDSDFDAEPVSEVIQTRTQRIWLRRDGIVNTVNNVTDLVDVDHARENVAAVKRVAGGVKRPIYVDTTLPAPLTVEARDYYVSDEVAEVVSAVGIVVQGAVGRFIGNFVLKRKQARVKMQLFESEQSALSWLATFLPSPAGPLAVGQDARTDKRPM
jgi:hypothetical protein